jgi:hypothetical protein
VAPETGVELLIVQDDRPRSGDGVRLAGEIRDVRHPALFVDDQVLDQVQVFRLGHRPEARRIGPVVSAIVHVHVEVARPPPARGQIVQTREPDLNGGRRARGDPRDAPGHAILRPAGHLHRHVPPGHGEDASPGRVEVRVLEPPLRVIHAVVRMAPGVIGRERAAVRPRDRHPGGHLASGGGIDNAEREAAHWVEIAPGRRHHLLSRPTGDFHYPERRVAGLIRDVGDPPAVRRPARVGRVEIAVGELERVLPVGRHEPELVPLAPLVGRVDHPPPVAGPIRPRAPGRLLDSHLPHGRARLRRHPPQRPRTPDVPPVGEQDQLLPVRRPRGREVLVEDVVVVAGELAVPVFGDAGEPADPAALDGGNEDVEAAQVGGRDKSEAPAVRRPAGLDVHRAVRHQRRADAGAEIEQAQIQRPSRVRHVGHVAPVRRPVRLVGVIGPVGELAGLRAPHPLAPQRALHRVDQLAPVRRPRGGARAAGHLGEIHLAVVVAVRLLDLREDRLSLCACLAYIRETANHRGTEAQREDLGVLVHGSRAFMV